MIPIKYNLPNIFKYGKMLKTYPKFYAVLYISELSYQ